MWLHHGSSISAGSEAGSPTTTWPARAAALGGVELVNLGFGGSALLDPFVARTMRDTPADLISIKMGINLVNADVMRKRAFTAGVHGFLDTVRDGHPDTPLLVVSPIWCGHPRGHARPAAAGHERDGGRPAPVPGDRRPGRGRRSAGSPCEVIRAELERIVAQRAATDPHLHYLDGLSCTARPDAAELPLPDDLHPDAATHLRIGERFAAAAFARAGIRRIRHGLTESSRAVADLGSSRPGCSRQRPGVARRARWPTRATPHVEPAAAEFALIASLYAVWRLARMLPIASTHGAIARAHDIASFQDALHLPSELSLQQFVLAHDRLADLTTWYYATVHVPALIAFLVWLFVRHRDKYPHWRNGLALVTAWCLVIRFVRVAPPRFLPDLGYVDMGQQYGMSVYAADPTTGVSDQFAAMPSIHVAWAAVVSLRHHRGEHQPVALVLPAARRPDDAGRLGDRQPLVAGRHRRDRPAGRVARGRHRRPALLPAALRDLSRRRGPRSRTAPAGPSCPACRARSAAASRRRSPAWATAPSPCAP